MPDHQPLYSVTNWIGNSFGFAPGYNGGKHVQNDIPYGVRAYKRANNEHLIVSEEDSQAKVLMYRWTLESAAPRTGDEHPQNDPGGGL